MFPDARSYSVTINWWNAKTDQKITQKAHGKDKIVDGKYIVSTLVVKNDETISTTVLYYEEKTKLFKQWSLLPNGDVTEMTGTGDQRVRAIAWTGKYGEMTSVGITHHTDTASFWKASYFEDGEFVHNMNGFARAQAE